MSNQLLAARNFIYNLPKLLYTLFKYSKSLITYVLLDPTIVANIHGKKLYLPLSHNLPIYVRRFKYYDTALTRISQFLRKGKKTLYYIDVGANIGDSILAINPQQDDRIIGVEPNLKFGKYLRRNLKGLKNVIIENVVCSSSSLKEKMKILEKNGTARIVHDKDANLVTTDTLDNIFNRSNLNALDLLKVDTDGHDFEVLKGARTLIRNYSPAILFECDSFTNSNYINDALDLFDFLRSCGYRSVLVYDNFGYLFGKFDLVNEDIFRNLLNYQLNSEFYYYDILVMREDMLCKFADEEKAFLWIGNHS